MRIASENRVAIFPNRVIERNSECLTSIHCFQFNRAASDISGEKMDTTNMFSDDEQRLFIQAFAVPTEAYRFYEEHRKQNPPLFLNRNLTYANYKKCRTKKARRRSSGKFNTLHAIVDKLAEQKRGTQHYMTLTFSGFHCDELMNGRHAEVQVIHKQSKTKLTSVIIDINPNDITSKGLSTVSLPTDMLKITSPNGGLLEISSCILQFKVRVLDRSVQHSSADDSQSLENCIFEAELELVDKCRNGLIASGQRELTFSCEPHPGLMSLPKQAMWKIKHFVKKSLSMSAIGDDDEILKPAKMQCHLKWSREIFRSNENKENGHSVNGTTNGTLTMTNGVAPKRIFTRSRSTGSIMIHRRYSTFRSNDNIQCLVYQFIHKGYRQKTEIWDRLKCPWCALRAANLYILLKHLTLCHGRFKFKYVPSANEQRIDVFINKREEDGAIDPFSRMATRFQGREPHKRPVRTGIIVNRPERQRPRLSEFLSLDTNINRTFYHSVSGIPLKSSEIDIDSEDEIDPDWLRKNTIKMIDDFVDVNDGEKGIMKLWNLFVLKRSFVSDSQIPAAAIEFIETHGEFIVTNHLYRNCIIHLTNLFDYGLISAKDHYKATNAMHAILHRNNSLVNTLKEQIEEQRNYLRSRVLIPNIGGKTVNKQKRSVQRVYLANKRRLRSQSRCEPICTRNKVKRIEALNCSQQMQQKSSPSILTPRPVRKLARITK